MLSNCDAEIIKFPSRYLAIPMSALDALGRGVRKLTSETTKST